MKFNLWFQGNLEEANADVGLLLRWLGELRFDNDIVVDVSLSTSGMEEDK